MALECQYTTKHFASLHQNDVFFQHTERPFPCWLNRIEIQLVETFPFEDIALDIKDNSALHHNLEGLINFFGGTAVPGNHVLIQLLVELIVSTRILR
jgi:hypothetical protein